jgi:hypothetical protein
MAAEQGWQRLGAAIDAFLARADLAASSRRSYAQTQRRLGVSARGVGARRRRGPGMSRRCARL